MLNIILWIILTLLLFSIMITDLNKHKNICGIQGSNLLILLLILFALTLFLLILI